MARTSVWFGPALAAALAGGCIAEDSPVLEGECDEFVRGGDIQADVDPTVLRFMQAASTLAGLGDDMAAAVFEACAGIATDLGASDSWSGLEGLDKRISNADGTGACDAAGARIEDILADAGEVNATVALLVTRGECHIDFDAQAECDRQCALDAVCDPGTIETRCEPGDLSVVCHAECEAGATCAGTFDLPANCMGACESECVGACSGTCVDADGKRTENDPNCHGKCTSACNGTCRGQCRLDAAIECGVDVHCEGGCTGTFSDPVCTSEYTPPQCTVDPDCHAACTAEAEANAICEPTRVALSVDVATSPELQPLADALEAHLPALFDAAEMRGPIFRDALGDLQASGAVIAEDLGDLPGKELACVSAAAEALLDTIDLFDVTLEASLHITVTTSETAM